MDLLGPLSPNPLLSVIPAELSFLAIYNPTFGATDETFEDQIFFYYNRPSGNEQSDDETQRNHEKARQIGLAQGMVNFAKNFADQSLDHIDTDKTRIVITELEENWWIVASIKLTKVPIAKSSSDIYIGAGDGYESSSRDISPPALLITQLINAHRIFLLHNGPCLSRLLNRLDRLKFCRLMERFWLKFAQRWNIMLEGIPVTDLLGGIKLAAGGELGVGVGEEEWGSGEREVLEDFISRTLGLHDLIVARFGDIAPESQTGIISEPWMGIGSVADAEDGVVFSGTGNIVRESVKDIYEWLRWVYTYGEAAYGVRESPSSDRRKRKKKATLHPQSPVVNNQTAGIPKSLLGSGIAEQKEVQSRTAEPADSKSEPSLLAIEAESWTKYLKFGYGTLWGIPDSDMNAPSATTKLPRDIIKSRILKLISQENSGYFPIGLQGDPDDDNEDVSPSTGTENLFAGLNQRLMIRTLHVTLSDTQEFKTTYYSNSESPNTSLLNSYEDVPMPESSIHSGETAASAGNTRLRLVLYAHRPFIYALLYDDTTTSVSMPTHYRSLHTLLSSLHPLLLRRTGSAVAQKRMAAETSFVTVSDQSGSKLQNTISKDVWSAIWDVRNGTIWSSLPAIPSNAPNTSIENINEPVWGRTDAMSIYNAALELISCARLGNYNKERSVKTGKGWWVVWAVQGGEEESFVQDSEHAPYSILKGEKQVVIIKKPQVGDVAKPRISSGWGLSGIMGKDHNKMDASKIGVGFDPRMYMEGIVRLGKQ